MKPTEKVVAAPVYCSSLAIVLIALLALVSLTWMGCQDDPPPAPATVENHYPPFGEGTLSFVTTDSAKFSASGPYKPSALFAADTLGEGAGGFILDTVIAGKPLKSELTAYTHVFLNGMLKDQVLVISLFRSSGAIVPGIYTMVRPGTSATGKYATATFLYYSDSVGQYLVYESRNGYFSMSTLDLETNEMTGSFAGLLRGLPPDTANIIYVAQSEFDVRLANHYFEY